jgi:cytochrome c5
MDYLRGIVMAGCFLLLVACDEPTKQARIAPLDPKPTFPEFPDADLQQGRVVWLGSCKVCHANGQAGAPKIGNRKDWQARIAQGKPTLYQHALKGFMGPAGTEMPARGGNDALSDSEVKAAVDYMVAASQ